MYQPHPKVERLSYWVRQLNLLISENLTEVLPLALPLPFVAIIVFHLYTWVLPFASEGAKITFALIGGIVLEFFGATSISMAMRIKNYNLIREKGEPKVAVWPALMGMFVYLLVATMMITFGSVLPAYYGEDSFKMFAPYVLYGFVVLIPFGYYFLEAKSTIGTTMYKREQAAHFLEEQKSAASQQQVQAIASEQRAAEVDYLRAQADAMRLQAQADLEKAKAGRLRAEGKKDRPVAPTPVPRNLPVNPTDLQNMSFEDITALKLRGAILPQPNEAALQRYQQLLGRFGESEISIGDGTAELGLSPSGFRKMAKALYVAGMVEPVSDGKYRIVNGHQK